MRQIIRIITGILAPILLILMLTASVQGPRTIWFLLFTIDATILITLTWANAWADRIAGTPDHDRQSGRQS